MKDHDSLLLDVQVYDRVGHQLYMYWSKYKLSVSQESNDAANTNSNAYLVC